MLRVGRRIYGRGGYTEPFYPGFTPIPCLSKSTAYGELSPYLLKNEDGILLENLWQFSKVYQVIPESIQPYSKYDSTIIWCHPREIHINSKNELTEAYWEWRKKGMQCSYPIRYPVGYNHRHKCLFSLFEAKKNFFIELDYVESRKQLYLTEYIKAVKKEKKFLQLAKRLSDGENLLIIESDGPHQESLEYYKEKYGVESDFIEKDTMLCTPKSLEIMLNDTKHPFGHGYALAYALIQSLQ